MAERPEYTGAPLPPNESERWNYLCSLNVLDTEPEQKFDDITRLCCMVFKVPICLVSLVDKERQWFKSVQGITATQTDRRSSFCAWTLLPAHPEVLVVEDAAEDVRFVENPLVVGPPHIRFYAGCPLVSTTRLRLGSLCIIDTKPRTFDADNCNMLANMAEMVVREIEKEKMLQLQRQRSAILSAENTQLLRAMDCFKEGIMLCNFGQPAWPILFVNEAFTSAGGVSRDIVGHSFWDVFSLPECTADASRRAALEAVNDLEPFRLTVGYEEGRQHNSGGESVVDSGGPPPRLVTLSFRSATQGGMDQYMPLVGVPAFLPGPDGTDVAAIYYFGTLVEGAAPASRNTIAAAAAAEALALSHLYQQPASPSAAASPSSGASSALGGPPTPLAPGDRGGSGLGAAPSRGSTGPGSSLPDGGGIGAVMRLSTKEDPFDDVRLKSMIGSGAFGRVYRGVWNGAPVAVKVMEHSVSPLGSKLSAEAMEALLSGQVSHPNIVITYKYSNKDVGGNNCGAAGGERMIQTWLVMEFCNKGSLTDAVDKGWFKKRESIFENNYRAVMATATEVAGAMCYLHARGILHGDLTGNNVLLAASEMDERRFTAKVADFGLSRMLEPGQEGVTIATHGTVTHMAPEVLTDGLLTRAADVYSFGILLWEMVTGHRPFRGLSQAQIIAHVTGGRSVQIPTSCPDPLRDLVASCCSHDMAQRPSFSEVLNMLEVMEEEMQMY